MTGFAEYDNYDGLGLAKLVRDGDVSPGELLEEAIGRTERVNGELNAVVHEYYDLARAAVAAGLPEGPFRGVPFLLKDLHLAMTDTVTSNGSAMWREAVADHDSTLVQRYRQAGVTIFGPAINVNTSKSLPFNLARSLTYTKACSEASEIPVHANLGMGVGGVPMVLSPPVDALSRASKAHVEICRLDGL